MIDDLLLDDIKGMSALDASDMLPAGASSGAQMREAVESSPNFKFSGPAMVVASMMSDAQEMMAYEQPDFNLIEDQRQLLNRAKFVLFTYIMDKETA